MVNDTPVIVLENRYWHEKRMRYGPCSGAGRICAARQQGVARAEEVKFAIVERNGSISILKKDDQD
jgi:uncharacterized membrane protein YcaP (DUF421 family)